MNQTQLFSRLSRNSFNATSVAGKSLAEALTESTGGEIVFRYSDDGSWSASGETDQRCFTVKYTTTDNQPLAISTISNGGYNYTYNGPQLISNEYDPAQGCCVMKLSGDTITTTVGVDMANHTYGINFCQDPDFVSTPDHRLVTVTLPENITAIGDKMFNHCTNLVEARAMKVTSLGEGVFSTCTALEHVYLPTAMTTLGTYTFDSCVNLTDFVIPTGLTEIGKSTFRSCSKLTGAMTIPYGVKTIGKKAFSYCSGVTSINIPEGVTAITGGQNFSYCLSLTGMTLPSTLSSIAEKAFECCSSIKALVCNPTTPPTLGTGVFSNTGYWPIIVPHASLSAYETAWSGDYRRLTANIPNDEIWYKTSDNAIMPVSVISYNGTNYTYNGPAITNVYDPAKGFCVIKTNDGSPITYFGVDIANTTYGINFCQDTNYITSSPDYRLKSVVLPTSVTAVGDKAFNHNLNLVKVDMRSVLSIGYGAFSASQSLENAMISPIMTSIGADAFDACSDLVNFVIPSGITNIPHAMLCNCKSLTGTMVVPDTVTELGEQCFRYCTGLTEVVIPNSVTAITSNAFVRCSSMDRVVIPSSVTFIGSQCFEYCEGLTSITCLRTAPPTLDGGNAFNITNDCTIYIPSGSLVAYTTEPSWSAYVARLQELS